MGEFLKSLFCQVDLHVDHEEAVIVARLTIVFLAFT